MEPENISFYEVYLSDTYLGIYEVKTKNNKIYFINKHKDIINKITSIINFKNEDNIKNINGIPYYSIKCKKSCFEQNIIFATKNEKITLYIKPESVESKNKKSNFLPKPTSGYALSNSTYFYHNQTDNNQFYHWDNESVISYKNNRFTTNWNINDSSENINESYYSKDIGNNSLKAGIFSFENQSFIDSYGTPTLYGISLKTNYKNFSSDGSFPSEPLEVFLDSRSKVEIFKDNRLYFSDIYDQGIQNININSLPSGSYYLTVKITDLSNNNVNTYQEFYSKNSFLPIKGKNLYFFDIGFTSKKDINNILPEKEENIFLRIGEKRKLYKNIGTYNEISFIKDTTYVSPSLFFVTEKGNINTSYYKASNGNEGISTVITGQIDSTKTANLNYRKEDIKENIVNSQEQKKINNENIGLSFNHNLKNYGNYSLGYNYFNNKTENNSNTSEGYYFRYSKNFNHNRGRSNISLSLNSNESKNYISLKYNYYFNNKNVNHNLRYGYSDNTENRNEIYYSANAQHINDSVTNTYDFNVYNNFDNQDANVSYNRSDKKTGSLDINLNKNSNSEKLNTTTRFENTTTYTPSSGVSFGLNNGLNNGVIVDLTKYKSINKNVIIKVNGIEYTKIKTGQKIFIPLKEYKEYYISTSIENSIDYRTEQTKEMVVLYKSNIDTIKPKIFKTNLYLSQFLNNKDILKNKVVKTEIGTFLTDEQGFAQIEINSETPNVQIENLKCKIQSDNNEIFTQVDKTLCD